MRVLVVEDDADLQDKLISCLSSASYAVDAAASGIQGLELAKNNDYDLIVLDYGLPEMSGLEICHELRTKGKSAPILILSVYSEPAHKAELINQGADDYLAKPFSVDELLARLNALLRRPKKFQSDTISLGGLLINLTEKTASAKGGAIPLTRKEFALLEYLVRQRGLIVSRNMILDHVWNMEGDIFSNAIETHILRLRKKLALAGHRHVILTKPGRGYTISADFSG